MGVVSQLNQLNTPWVAIIVIVLGMIFAVVCKVYGLNSDMASGVLGAGIGLLTGQALAKSQQPGTHLEVDSTNNHTLPGMNDPAQPQPKQ